VADRLIGDVPGILEATCVMVSQIGRPIDDPQIVDVRVVLERRQPIGVLRQPVRDVVDQELSKLTTPQALERMRLY
jgi:S-adenosylmethionine synthetase